MNLVLLYFLCYHNEAPVCETKQRGFAVRELFVSRTNSACHLQVVLSVLLSVYNLRTSCTHCEGVGAVHKRWEGNWACTGCPVKKRRWRVHSPLPQQLALKARWGGCIAGCQAEYTGWQLPLSLAASAGRQKGLQHRISVEKL